MQKNMTLSRWCVTKRFFWHTKTWKSFWQWRRRFKESDGSVGRRGIGSGTRETRCVLASVVTQHMQTCLNFSWDFQEVWIDMWRNEGIVTRLRAHFVKWWAMNDLRPTAYEAPIQIWVVYLHSQGLNKSRKRVLRKSNHVRESNSLDREI